MAEYFSYFQKGSYDFGSGITKTVTDISKYTSIFSSLADDVSFYTYYRLNSNQRFDEISQELYATPDFYWTIPLINPEILNTWDSTFKDENTFQDYLRKKYPGTALFIDPADDMIGKFEIGEIIAYDVTNVFEIGGKYPSQNYIYGLPVDLSRFDVLNDPEEVWVNLTGLWNEVNANIWVDIEKWKDTTQYIIGQNNLDVLKVSSTAPGHKAPAYFLDPDGNVVPWYVENATPVTIEEVERQKNEVAGRIKVIRPEFIYEVASRFEAEMRRRRG